MTDPLRLLVIEDSEADFLLVQRSLKQHEVEALFHRVQSYAELSRALEDRGWDAILSDYNVPGMDFRTILGLIRNEAPDLPVLLVSGSIGEEEAIELLHRGLSDYVLKDRPTRLAGALRHSLETARVRKAQRSAEAALQESEARFATIFRSSPLAIGLSRMADGKLAEVNEAFLEIVGRPREAVIGQTTVGLGLFEHPEDRARMIQRVQRDGRIQNFQFQNRKPDGSLRDFLLSGERIQLGGELYMLGMVSDITPLKATERALQASELRYRRLFEGMSEAFAHCRLILEEGRAPDWEYLAVNPTYGRITGLGDVTGRRMSEVLPSLPTDAPDVVASLRRVAESGLPTKFETFVPPLGRWLSVSAYCPVTGEFVVMLEDISDRKLAEQALQASEARFLAVFKASPVGIMLSNLADGGIIDANPAFLGLIGRSLEEVLGRSTLELGLWVRPEQRQDTLRLIRETGRVPAMDVELQSGSVDTASVIWSTELVQLGGESILVNLVQDQTARRRAEEEHRRLEAEVAHAQKLESLGALAGGISHDMNNVLAAIMALGSMLRETHQEVPGIAKAMDTLLHAAGRGRDLVKGLTNFARKDILEPQPMDLNEVVRKDAALLHRTTLQKVAVELALAEGLPNVMGDPSAISNALMNLCVNALDAMPGGGRLTLATRRGPGGTVELLVEDTGEGMPPEVAQRAMEPFFTTKPIGKGTGLGLALVYGVMKSHGGRVEIRSAPGEGTGITLSFPELSEGPPPAIEEEPSRARTGRRFRILLVDDDDLIRNTVPEMLESLGHEVAAVMGGLPALQLLQSGYEPDLVILDLSMPGMDGEETLERLRLLKPDLPVLLATGYRDERSGRIFDQFERVDLIMKPFSLMDLRVKLGQMG
ncbi:histidine kinase [Geothrix rubra]|uniref:histidine kinase n=1 Tax=Geothrix rubra TaxID=2927977 RepID=A0ABQ5Q8C7_9BACT|nr:response regulator [Geothrix rubra]GLH70601.1 histidine kinase [Geothrix rubra]